MNFLKYAFISGVEDSTIVLNTLKSPIGAFRYVPSSNDNDEMLHTSELKHRSHSDVLVIIGGSLTIYKDYKVFSSSFSSSMFIKG